MTAVIRTFLIVCVVLYGASYAGAATLDQAARTRQPSTHDAVPRPTAAAPTPAPVHVPAPPSIVPIPEWLVALLVCLGIALLVAMGAVALRFFLDQDNKKGAGSLILLTLPILAVLGLVLIPFAPGLDTGRWIPVDVLAIAVFVGGAFLGFLYGLPVVDADALKTAGSTAGTFIRPSTKLEKVTDSLMTAFTGGVVVFALTQGSRFNAFFLQQTGLTANNFSSLLGIAMLLYFAPIGFVLAYVLTATVGALAFKRAEESLVDATAIVKSFPPLADLPLEPTPEQLAAAGQIAARPYASLANAAEKSAWARAQTLLKNYPQALAAYQDAVVLDPRNPGLLVDYATTVYNDPTIDDIPTVISLLNRAQAAAGAQTDSSTQRRILALRASANLYVEGGYEQTIQIVNEWLSGPVTPTRLARYYRACAFGQLYEACATIPLPGAAPFVGLSAADDAPLRQLVRNDVNVTIASAPGSGKQNVRMVVDPSSPLRLRADDDDLQMLAADDPVLCTQVGLAAPPPPPQTPHPRLPVVLPNPVAAPGTLGAWITANCPP